MSKSLEAEFGFFRSIFWPIHRHELKKLYPMLIMGFLICFNYSILRNVKDSLVVTGTDAGAAVIPFIKVWLILPAAVIFTFIFTQLCNRYSQEKVFYIVITSFIILFALFGFILYPIRESLELVSFSQTLETILPIGCHGAVMMCRHWILAGFYVICEMWASMVLAVLFWGFANEVTRIEEARRFYGVLAIATNIAAIVAGMTGGFLSYGWVHNPALPFGASAWEQSVCFLILVVILSGILTMITYHWMNKNVLTGDEYANFRLNRMAKKEENKLSLGECFSYLSKSKYLICIAILVIAYNLVINLVEVVWKDQLRQLYPSAADFNTYLYSVTVWMGVIATIAAVLMPFIVDRFGWTKIALITPAILLITSLGFFGSIFFENTFSMMFVNFVGVTPIALAIFFGAAQNCLSKAAKYSVFDMTKEMAFIPLSHEYKLNGKAAIDGVGSRFGKSGGSVIHHGLLILFTSLSACVPYLAIIVMMIIFVWMGAVRSLGKQFDEAVAKETNPSPQVV